MTQVSSSADALVLLPTDRFFLQMVPLEAGVPAVDQVSLAIEAHSPFPPAQLYHGFVTNPRRTRALAFACYRRRFSAEDQVGWPAATAVLPSVVALLGPAPARPTLVIHEAAGLWQGVAWDGQGDFPVAVRARLPGQPADRLAFLQELTQAAGLTNAAVREVDGDFAAHLNDGGDAVFKVGVHESLRLGAGALAAADVRDKSFLEDKARRQVRDRRWFFAAVAAVGLVGVAAGMDLVNGGLALWNRRDRAALALHAGEAREIEAAQTMAMRIEQLAVRQQRPLEWLSAIGAVRPRSVQFTRVVGRNDRTLEIEAQTANANDVGAFETALRAMAGVDHVEIRDLRAREGLTSFVVALAFKPATASVAVAGGRP